MRNSIDVIDSLIPKGYENAVTRGYLHSLTGYTDREIRGAIETLMESGDEIIINLQDGKGYFRPDLPKELDLVERWISMYRSRIDSEDKRVNRVMNRLCELGLWGE